MTTPINTADGVARRENNIAAINRFFELLNQMDAHAPGANFGMRMVLFTFHIP